MIQSSVYEASLSNSIYRTVKFGLIVASLTWGLVKFADSFSGDLRMKVTGQFATLQMPEPNAMRMTGPDGLTMTMKSQWQFRIHNKGTNDATAMQFKLPFNGFYQIIQGGRQSELTRFTGIIPLERVNALEEATLLVWTDREASAELQKETQLVNKGAIVPVEYPVQVSGILAWAEQSKALISILIILLALVVLL